MPGIDIDIGALTQSAEDKVNEALGRMAKTAGGTPVDVKLNSAPAVDSLGKIEASAAKTAKATSSMFSSQQFGAAIAGFTAVNNALHLVTAEQLKSVSTTVDLTKVGMQMAGPWGALAGLIAGGAIDLWNWKKAADALDVSSGAVNAQTGLAATNIHEAWDNARHAAEATSPLVTYWKDISAHVHQAYIDTKAFVETTNIQNDFVKGFTTKFVPDAKTAKEAEAAWAKANKALLYFDSQEGPMWEAAVKKRDAAYETWQRMLNDTAGAQKIATKADKDATDAITKQGESIQQLIDVGVGAGKDNEGNSILDTGGMHDDINEVTADLNQMFGVVMQNENLPSLQDILGVPKGFTWLHDLKVQFADVGASMKKALLDDGLHAAKLFFDQIQAGQVTLKGLAGSFLGELGEFSKEKGAEMLIQGLVDEATGIGLVIRGLGISPRGYALMAHGAEEMSLGLLLGAGGAAAGKFGARLSGGGASASSSSAGGGSSSSSSSADNGFGGGSSSGGTRVRGVDNAPIQQPPSVYLIDNSGLPRGQRETETHGHMIAGILGVAARSGTMADIDDGTGAHHVLRTLRDGGRF